MQKAWKWERAEMRAGKPQSALGPEAVEAAPYPALSLVMCEPRSRKWGPIDSRLAGHLLCKICFVGENHEIQTYPLSSSDYHGRRIGPALTDTVQTP